AGLAAATRLKRAGLAVRILEKDRDAGGTARSDTRAGYTFDRGIHGLYSSDTEVIAELSSSSRSEVIRFPLNIADYWHGYKGPHPAQSALSCYPEAVSIVIADEMLGRLNITQAAQDRDDETHRTGTYEDWCLYHFGPTFSAEFLFPYARKFWTVEPHELTTDWTGKRVPIPTREQLLAVHEGPVVPYEHYVREVLYPQSGGFGSFFFGLANELRIDYACPSATVMPERRQVATALGELISYDALVSTIPLPSLVRQLTPSPTFVSDAANGLLATAGAFVNIGVSRLDLLDEHWLYVYDADIPFARVSSPSRWAHENAPDGAGSLQAEVYYRGRPPNAAELTSSCIAALRRMRILREADAILYCDVVFQPVATVIYDHRRNKAVDVLRRYCEDNGIHLAGRYSRWDHSLVDASMRQGWEAADAVLQAP
ncbi:MAG: FAD-dependent oxidoreductase, partial [Actinomycetota bacterium]|nr:FAD-dependent oxidoreductase [Actinomycetota bacterium]